MSKLSRRGWIRCNMIEKCSSSPRASAYRQWLAKQ
jgi:hypothetical protein